MANLKDIRTRLSSVKLTRQITSAMKMVAASRLRKAQDKIVKLRPYADKLHEILLDISMHLDESEGENGFSRVSDPKNVLLIVVTSNRGLCGAFNSNVIKETIRTVNEKYPEQFNSGNLRLMTIGKKGADYFKKRGWQISEEHTEIFENLSFEEVNKLAQNVMNSFLEGEYDRVEIIYNQFKNAAVQILTNETFLPVENDENSHEGEQGDYIYEPSKEEIIQELIPKTLKIQFYKSLLDSFVAEHGARMTAMHMATDNATEMIRDLTLEYNKARQASITNQILEVVSGAEALK
ncbi:MAG: ATP synthase F1 subunit gamma [Bacteroidales bacterium]|nr:ATP synthase F1 subunit gamma [Bacteroidales bacterium]